MSLANTIVAIPLSIKIISTQISNGTISSSQETFEWYGDPTPHDMPFQVRQVSHGFIQWYVTSGNIEQMNSTINGDGMLKIEK